MDGSQRGMFASKMTWCVVVSLTLALAACGSSSDQGKSSHSLTEHPPTATISLASAHADWTTLASTPPNAATFMFAPSNPHVSYICTQVNSYTSQEQPKLYKTTDGGQTWAQMSGLPLIQQPAGMSISPLLTCNTFVDGSDPSDVFLQQLVLDPQGVGHAVARALYRSRDGAVTWSQALGTLDRTNGFDQLAVVGSRVIASAHPSLLSARGCSVADPFPPEQPASVLYASDDGGQTWQQIGQPIEDQHLAVTGMAMMGTTVVAIAKTLYPGGCGGTFQATYSLWQSADGGATWARIAIPTNGTPNQLYFARRAASSGYYGVARISNMNADGSYRSDLIFTSDSGATWSLVPAIPSDLAGTSSGGPLVAVTPSGAILISEPGGIVALRPNDPSPAWKLYASDVKSPIWQIVRGQQGTILWVLDTSGNTAKLMYLPLP